MIVLADFWESLIAILIVIIPTATGAVFSKFIVNKWQDKNQKFQLKLAKSKLRKEILKDYQNGLVAYLLEIGNFYRMVKDHYILNRTYFPKEKVVKGAIIVPQGDENLPKNVFANELQKYDKRTDELDIELWNFFSTRNVYYDKKELVDLTHIVFNQLLHGDKLLRLTIESKNTEEFKKYCKIVDDILDELEQKISDLAQLLADTPLKELPD